MVRRSSGTRLRTIFLVVALLAYPCAMFAQHGGGGGRIGGSAAGGSGLSGGNNPSGIDTKDDLKSFHDVLAVQASREQVVAYAAMLNSTAAAEAELKALEGQLAKENTASDLSRHDKALGDALESARILNKKFLEGFSERQKTGLKEITKRLGKTDSDLAQQAKAFDQAVEANVASSQMAGSAQNLEHALANFQRSQVDLGQEMSIATANNRRDSVFNLIPLKNSLNVANQSLAITTSGVISKGTSQVGQNAFAVDLTADLSDVQLNIADLMRAQLDKADRCGERIAIQTAALTPQGPAGLVVLQLHFERWTCATLLGRDSMNEIAEGNGTMEVRLTPVVAEDGTLRLVAKIGRVDAEGLVGDSLRSGSLGDKVSESMLTIMRQGGDFRASLPAGARSYATLHRAQFEGTGSGKLMLVLNGEIRVSDDQLTPLTTELERASQVEPVPGPLLPRPSPPAETVSR